MRHVLMGGFPLRGSCVLSCISTFCNYWEEITRFYHVWYCCTWNIFILSGRIRYLWLYTGCT